MEVFLTYMVIEGVILYTLNKKRFTEQQLLRRWVNGRLSYEDIQVLKNHKTWCLKKLDRRITVGKHPGFFKKED